MLPEFLSFIKWENKLLLEKKYTGVFFQLVELNMVIAAVLLNKLENFGQPELELDYLKLISA